MSLTGNAIVELRPDRWAAGGDAIAKAADGRVVFVSGAVPGETVQAEITASKKDFQRAVTLEVVEASPDRLAPPCPYLAAGCGGCSWQHVDHQLRHKTDIVRDALRRTARLPEAEVHAAGTVDAFGYRTTLRLAADRGRVGFRAAASHRVVPIEHCMVAHQQVNDIVPALHADRGEVTVRVSLATGEHTLLDDAGTTKGGPRRGRAADSVVEVVAGASLRVSASSFFQSGVQAAELLVHTVRSALGDRVNDHGHVLDAYGGIGLFSAALPLRAPIIVEGSPSACDDARVNLPHAVVAETAFERWSPSPVSTAVVDPARAGLGRDAAAVLAATGAEVVALVSCDPVAMARDVALLAEHGYQHRSTQVLDLFPQTPHVEAVTVLER